MRSGNSILNFYCGNEEVYKQDYFRNYSKDTKRGYGVEIIIPHDDINTLYETVTKKYKNLVVEPLVKRFSKFDFRITDPFGFYLRFVERYDWVNGRDQAGNSLS
jgi:hypothetical protein